MSNAVYEPPRVRAVSADHVASTVSYMTSGGFTGGDVGTETGEQRTRREFLEVLQGHFGFDEAAAQLIDIALSCMVAYCAGAAGNRALKAAWAFFRTIGAMVYGRSGVGATMWEMTAGSAESVYNGAVLEESQQGGVIVAEDEFFTDMLGMDEWQYRRLRYQVWVQHELCGYKRSLLDNEEGNKHFPKKVRQLKNEARAGYSLAYGSSLPFDDEWEGLKRRMALMPDFAHFCITLSAHLATRLGYTEVSDAIVGETFGDVAEALGGADVALESLAGWLGDAKLFIDDTVSFRWDDYWADIDALGIASRGLALGYDVRAMFCDYYFSYGESGGSMTCFRRKEILLTHFSISQIAEAIKLFPPSVAALTFDGLLMCLDNYKPHRDAYRFLCRISKSDADLQANAHREEYHAATSYLYGLQTEEDEHDEEEG